MSLLSWYVLPLLFEEKWSAWSRSLAVCQCDNTTYILYIVHILLLLFIRDLWVNINPMFNFFNISYGKASDNRLVSSSAA